MSFNFNSKIRSLKSQVEKKKTEISSSDCSHG